MGVQKNHLIEMVLFEHPQHMVWLRNKNDNYQLLLSDRARICQLIAAMLASKDEGVKTVYLEGMLYM